MNDTFLVKSFLSDETWTGSLRSFVDYGSFQLISFSARSSLLEVIVGQCDSYRWVFLPNYEIGCMQADINDIFWNSEKLSTLIGPTDASTIVYGICYAYQKMNRFIP